MNNLFNCPLVKIIFSVRIFIFRIAHEKRYGGAAFVSLFDVFDSIRAAAIGRKFESFSVA